MYSIDFTNSNHCFLLNNNVLTFTFCVEVDRKDVSETSFLQLMQFDEFPMGHVLYDFAPSIDKPTTKSK